MQRSQGAYTTAVKTLTDAMAKLEKGSIDYLRVQNQIVQIQNQAARQASGNSVTGIAQTLRGLEGQIGRLQSFSSALGSLPGLGGIGRIAGDAAQAASGLQQLGSSGGAAGAGLSRLAVGGGLAAAGIGLVAAGAIAAARSTAEYGRQVEIASRITGVSATTVQALGIQAKLVGQNMTDTIDALNQFSTQIADARNGSEGLSKLFQKLGVNTNDVGLTTEKAFDQALRAISRLPAGIEKTSVASRLFGEKGARLALSLRGAETGIAGITAAARQYGSIIDGEAIQATSRYTTELARLEGQFDSLKTAIGLRFLPVLNAVLQGLNDAGRAGSSSFGFLFEGGRAAAAPVPVGSTQARQFEQRGQLNRGISTFLERNRAAETPRTAIGVSLLSNDLQALSKALNDRTKGIVQGARDEEDARKRLAAARRADPELDRGIRERQRLERNQRAIAGVLSPSDRAIAVRGVPEIPGLSRSLDFLPDSLKAIDERSKALGRSAEDLNKQLLDATRATTPLVEKLRILEPAADDAGAAYEQLRARLSGKKLSPDDVAQLAEARQRYEQIAGAARTTNQQLADNVIQMKAYRDELLAENVVRRLSANQQPESLPLGSLDVREILFRRPALTGKDLPGLKGGSPQEVAIRQGEQSESEIKLLTATRERLSGFERDVRRSFEDLFTGLLTGANTLRETFGNFFLSIGGNIAQRLSESVTDKLFDSVLNPFFDSISSGFRDLTAIISSLFGDLWREIIQPIGKSIGSFFGKILGSAFGGGFASGGFLQPGQFGIVGERGPEFAFGGRAGMTIINQQQMAGAGGYGTPNVTVNIYAQDAQSFQSAKSRAQVERQMANAVSRGMRQI